MKVNITMDNKTIIRIMAVAFGFILGLELLGQLWPIIRILIMAAFLAVALNPPVNYFAHKMTQGRRAMATAISYVFVVLVLVLLASITVPPFARETAKFIDELPTYVQDIRSGEGVISDAVDRLNLGKTLDEVTNNVTNYIGTANNVLLDGIGAVGTFVFTLLTVLVLAFFMLVEGPVWLNQFWEAQKPEFRERYEPLMYKVYNVITGYVNGQLFIASIAATTSLIAMLIAGIPYPLPLAALVGVFGLIPLVGATLGAVAVVLVALIKSLYAALFMAVFFLIYQQIENNAIQPYVQARTLDVSPLLVLVAVLIGASLGGLLGGLLAIPVAASIRIFYIDYHDRNVKKHYRKQKKAATEKELKV
jgi:predicted PurR-regulated permease PerM